MSEPEIQALEQKLDNILERLKATKDPLLRRPLLAEMRVLMAELDSFVFNLDRLPKKHPDPST